eukprot:CAMPEP_0202727150 /NCGR_PEP_ID=MMETSP1385-20130828/184980_1 /ASSEMBLY_ACC=CAM_ASM_000861 /TAXON_ID=933848 /ORGANISM="Elphidium margaritaceum" /LENGTH=490 /DNA_ID=CAMNT_0049393389 /DNA_START=64 /DNA_END=1536 /DNA_ORIENTATION=+
MELDFGTLYNRQHTEPPRYRKKPLAKSKKKKIVKKRKKNNAAPKPWDRSLSNLDSHRLSPSKQMERKLNSVSKHRHYAKDLVQEQRKKNLQRRRLEKEEQEIEQEQRQLIRRKQMLLRRHPMPNLKRAFPVFTAGRSEYDDDYDDDDVSEEEQSEQNDENEEAHQYQDDNDQEPNDVDHDDDDDDGDGGGEVDVAEVSVKALTHKLSSLEHELESMKRATENGEVIQQQENKKNKENENENENVSFDMERIHHTLNAVADRRTSKALHITLPSASASTPEPSTSATVSALDARSLLMLLEKLKAYFKEIEIEKKQNEEFRSTLLESVNAQNTQILHLLSQLASHQKLIDSLQDELKALKSTSCKSRPNSNMNAPQWVPFQPSTSSVQTAAATLGDDDGIALRDVKHILNQVRPQRTSVDAVQLPNAVMPPKPYTVQKYSRRSFLPSSQSQTEQIAIPPQPQPQPQPRPKPPRLSEPVVVINHPEIRVERF